MPPGCTERNRTRREQKPEEVGHDAAVPTRLPGAPAQFPITDDRQLESVQIPQELGYEEASVRSFCSIESVSELPLIVASSSSTTAKT